MPNNTEYETFSGQVQSVLSGDDMTVMLDLGVDGLHKLQRVRLDGVDAPDARSQPRDSPAVKLRDEVRALVAKRQVTVQVVARRSNCWIVVMDVCDENKTNLNRKLCAMGHAFSRPGSPSPHPAGGYYGD